MDLRHTPQAVSVLYPYFVRLRYLGAVRQQGAQIGSGGDLPDLPPYFVQERMKGVWDSTQGLYRHRPDDVGGQDQLFRSQQSEGEQARHHLCTVD